MLQEIQVRWGVKKRPHPRGGVWIFSGITHSKIVKAQQLGDRIMNIIHIFVRIMHILFHVKYNS